MQARQLSIILRISLILLAATLPVALADDASSITNRPAKDVVVDLPGHKETIRVAAAPYISSDEVITLYPGDKIIVEFEIINSAPKNPKVVKENLHPERTLVLKMTQDKEITMVTRDSGFAQKLSMESYFLTVGSDFKNNANMYPLEKNMGSADSFEPKTYCIKFYNFGFEP